MSEEVKASVKTEYNKTKARSFRFDPYTSEKLDELSQAYFINASEVMRNLIDSAHLMLEKKLAKKEDSE